MGFCQSTDELKLLKLFYEDKELFVSSTRYPKPITEIPENVTVVSKEEIRALNAHTLADVLERVIGIGIQRQGGIALPAVVVLLGNQPNKIKIMIDGIPINNLSDNTVDVGSIPVQHIERIEIIKGPASNVWGASLGGLINVITKEPKDSPNQNNISYSIGENETNDLRIQLAGKKDQFGYYLYAGTLKSDGLMPNNAFYQNNLFFKTGYDFKNNLNLSFSLGYHNISRQTGRD
ncbi:MAG: TonB-dependent receptor plug domain-containing protein, partial [Proteobacteria bacterium]|nr:TonB-dependent receptor plug domain-containing protein [Pseudomonadota bacterium]